MEPSEVPVLVVDDDPRKRFALKAVLAPLGYSIVEADSGIAALRCVMAQDFAVILLDVRMPAMDGFETATAIRERLESEMTPIIFITAFASDEISTDLYAAGAVDFMFAPVPPIELRAKVSVFARIFVQAAELATQRVELEAMNTELHAVARRDALTGLWNRRALQEDLEILEARAKRYDYSYCLALFDIDFFKAYNDALGHQAGDEALALVANSLRGEARSGDVIYRYGGEEFLCVLPEQTLETGALAAERMRDRIQSLRVPHTGSSWGVLTISVGLAVLDSAHIKSASDVLKTADEALYRAKELGRNRVVCEPCDDDSAVATAI
jgi:diguanylate cyclase (GGDEF)-like protein